MWPSRAFRLRPGDVMLLYTDGVTEAINDKKELFEIERLCAVVKENRKLPIDPAP